MEPTSARTSRPSASRAGRPPVRPGKAPGAGTTGQCAPENPGSDSVGGRVGEGSTSGSNRSAPGLGELAKVRTPYHEVLGQYTDQATEALERAYVPPDAKEYVKQYFT